jgi:hypothetical protein
MLPQKRYIMGSFDGGGFVDAKVLLLHLLPTHRVDKSAHESVLWRQRPRHS